MLNRRFALLWDARHNYGHPDAGNEVFLLAKLWLMSVPPPVSRSQRKRQTVHSLPIFVRLCICLPLYPFGVSNTCENVRKE
jgi:hypothetical protein